MRWGKTRKIVGYRTPTFWVRKRASEREREREANPRIIPLLILLLSSAGIISRSDVGSERSKGGALRPLVSGFGLKTREEEFRKVNSLPFVLFPPLISSATQMLSCWLWGHPLVRDEWLRGFLVDLN